MLGHWQPFGPQAFGGEQQMRVPPTAHTCVDGHSHWQVKKLIIPLGQVTFGHWQPFGPQTFGGVQQMGARPVLQTCDFGHSHWQLSGLSTNPEAQKMFAHAHPFDPHTFGGVQQTGARGPWQSWPPFGHSHRHVLGLRTEPSGHGGRVGGHTHPAPVGLQTSGDGQQMTDPLGWGHDCSLSGQRQRQVSGLNTPGGQHLPTHSPVFLQKTVLSGHIQVWFGPHTPVQQSAPVRHVPLTGTHPAAASVFPLSSRNSAPPTAVATSALKAPRRDRGFAMVLARLSNCRSSIVLLPFGA
jgi:hypothetical protein